MNRSLVVVLFAVVMRLVYFVARRVVAAGRGGKKDVMQRLPERNRNMKMGEIRSLEDVQGEAKAMLAKYGVLLRGAECKWMGGVTDAAGGACPLCGGPVIRLTELPPSLLSNEISADMYGPGGYSSLIAAWRSDQSCHERYCDYVDSYDAAEVTAAWAVVESLVKSNVTVKLTVTGAAGYQQMCELKAILSVLRTTLGYHPVSLIAVDVFAALVSRYERAITNAIKYMGDHELNVNESTIRYTTSVGAIVLMSVVKSFVGSRSNGIDVRYAWPEDYWLGEYPNATFHAVRRWLVLDEFPEAIIADCQPFQAPLFGA